MDERPEYYLHLDAENVHIDRREQWEVWVRGDLVDLRTLEVPHPENGDYNETWLSVEDARNLALELQEAARLIEESEALGTDDD